MEGLCCAKVRGKPTAKEGRCTNGDNEEATIAAWVHAWKTCSEAVEARGNDPSVWAESVEVQIHGAILGQPPLPCLSQTYTAKLTNEFLMFALDLVSVCLKPGTITHGFLAVALNPHSTGIPTAPWNCRAVALRSDGPSEGAGANLGSGSTSSQRRGRVYSSTDGGPLQGGE